MAESETRVSRDTRLLVLVIGIAVVVLFVLAQFRFPTADVRLSTVTPAGLDRLAAQSNYDDLASAVKTTMKGVEPSVVVFDVDGVAEGAKPPERRRVQAIRLREGLGVAALPAGFKSASASGNADVQLIRMIEPVRGLMIPVLTSAAAPARVAAVAGDFSGFAYVAVVEPANGGPTATPVFIGRIDPLRDDRWGGDLLVPGGSDVLPVGSFLFRLDGRFIGMVVRHANGTHAIAPAALLMSLIDFGVAGAEGPR